MAGQLWGVNTLGGYMYSLELSDVLRTAVQPLCKFRQFCDARDFTDRGLHKGQLFTWNVYNDVASQGTTLTETSTLPSTNFTIAQGTGTVTELGNAVPYTGMLDNLSKHPVQEIINKVLKNDAKKGLDGQAWNQFNQTLLRVVGTGSATTGTSSQIYGVALTTNGTATLTNGGAVGPGGITNYHVKAIVDIMKERNIPPYMGDEYFGIAWPTTWRPLKNTLEGIYQYRDEGFQMIYNGEIGKYEGVRFIEQTNVPHGIFNGGNFVVSSNFTPWVNGGDWAFFFGEDTVAEAIVVPEEMRGAIPSDFGRSKGIAWYYLGGFALTQTQALQSRIVKWDSKA
jgi:N4-gp56 family major capsid protein